MLKSLLPAALIAVCATAAVAAESCQREPTFEAWLDGVR